MVQDTVFYEFRAQELHFVRFHISNTLIFLRKFRDKVMYRDNNKMSFKIEFLYVAAECKNKHGKKLNICYIAATRLNGFSKVVTFLYPTNTTCIFLLNFIN